MEDGTYRRSLHTVLVAAFGISLIGAGCAGKTEPPQQQPQQETSPQVQANAAPAREELPKAAVPFIACFHGEADLFSSTANVSERWIDELREQLNSGWLIDVWCRETDSSGANLYGFALRRSQGVLMTDMASTTFSYSRDGGGKGSPITASEEEASAWSLVRLGYAAASRNRSNEIPLLLSETIAVKNEKSPVDALSFVRELNDAASAPRVIAADMHGGDSKGWFSVRVSYDPNTKMFTESGFCRTYFASEDGGFSPEDMKTECRPIK